jgi:hypothetical protein
MLMSKKTGEKYISRKRVVWVTCRQWEFRHLVWTTCYRGVGFKVPRAHALSGLKVYKCLPHDETGAKHQLEPDPSIDLTCGVPWSTHLGGTGTWSEGLGLRRGMVLRVP